MFYFIVRDLLTPARWKGITQTIGLSCRQLFCYGGIFHQSEHDWIIIWKAWAGFGKYMDTADAVSGLTRENDLG